MLGRLRLIWRGWPVWVVALGLVGIAVGVSSAARTDPVRQAGTAKTCAVTLPHGPEPPAAARAALPPIPPAFDGNGRLWVKLWPLGVIVARPVVVDPSGAIDVKVPWWRGVAGKLKVTGTRLDAPAPPLESNVPNGYGPEGFQATGLIFPTEGCWKVTGRVGTARLVFVTLVVKPVNNGY